MQKTIGTSMAAAMALVRSAFGGIDVPADYQLPVGGFKGKTKYHFRNTLRRISPTKRYASAKLRAYKSGNIQTKRSGRGATGARERAVGVHWVKS